MSLIFAASFSSAAWSKECPADDSQHAIGTPCNEESSCTVVGETHILEWKSPTPAKIFVVCIHGLGLCAKAYKPLAKELSAAGIDGFGVNVHGFGPEGYEENRGKLNCLKTVEDVTRLLTNIHQEHPDYKIFLIGESMGGALAIRIAAENPKLVGGVVSSAPAWKVLKMRRTAVKGVFELFMFPGRYPGLTGQAVMNQATTDRELIRHWLTDPSHKLKLTLKEATGFLNFISKTNSYARKLTTPVLVVQGLNDRLVSPKAVAKLFKVMPSNHKTFLIDGTGEHIVLEEGRYSRPVIEKLISWMKTDDHEKTSPQVFIEVVNDQALSRVGELRLHKLRRLASSRDELAPVNAD